MATNLQKTFLFLHVISKQLSFMKEEHTCLICLGSNLDAASHLLQAKQLLDSMFPAIEWGKARETKAEGDRTDLPPYLNQLALLKTAWDINELKMQLKQIEKANGRNEQSKASGLIPLDIDLLSYDKQVLKPQDFKKQYMQVLIGEFPSLPPFLLPKD